MLKKKIFLNLASEDDYDDDSNTDKHKARNTPKGGWSPKKSKCRLNDDDNSTDKPKARNTPMSGWSPSPKKSKCELNTYYKIINKSNTFHLYIVMISPISQNTKSVNSSYYKEMDHTQTKSISRKLSYSNANEGMLILINYIRPKTRKCWYNDVIGSKR